MMKAHGLHHSLLMNLMISKFAIETVTHTMKVTNQDNGSSRPSKTVTTDL